MDKYSILAYATTLLSDVVYVMAIPVILMIAACFLGRYVVITRKMIIASCGVILFSVLIIIIASLYIYKVLPDVATLESLDDITPEQSEVISQMNYIENLVLNVSIFIYAFIVFLFGFREKRVLRAIEATVCLYIYYAYLNSIVLNAAIFFMGGNIDVYNKVMFANSNEGVVMMFYIILADFIVTLLILLLLYFGYYKKHKFYVVRLRDRILFIVWLAIFSSFPGIPLGIEDINDRYQVLAILFGIEIPILGGLAPMILVMGAADKSLREKNEYQENYLAAELEYIEQYKRSQTETRAFRHDIINNLSLTNMMLDEGKTEEASAHLKELLGNVQALSPQYITGDEMLDCIVAMKAAKMEELGITFSSDGVVDGGLNMKPMDVCSIFANAIDNAIEAARKCPEDVETFVSLAIKRTEKFFVIRIENSAEGKVDVEKLLITSGYTSKKDKEHHGFGLRNIRLSVEKYDGLLKAESEEGRFMLSIMIPRK